MSECTDDNCDAISVEENKEIDEVQSLPIVDGSSAAVDEEILNVNDCSNDESSSSWDDSGDEEESNSDLHEAAQRTNPVLEDAFLRIQYRPDLESISDLPDTVTVLRCSKTGGTLFLVGTAHFSKESCKDVQRVIECVRPDRVVVELCQSRTQILHLNENYIQEIEKESGMDGMKKCIQQRGLVSGIVVYTMLYMSSHVTKQLGMAPGAEFRAAFHAVQHIPGCNLMFGDRPIGITMKRMLQALTFWQKIKFAFSLLCELKPITAEDVEKMKEKDIFEQMLNEIVVAFPHMAEVLVTERDLFLTKVMQSALESQITLPNNDVHPPVVVGVVGMGHTKGIVKFFDTEISQETMIHISSIPPPSKVPFVIKHVVRAGLAGAFVYSVYKFVTWLRV